MEAFNRINRKAGTGGATMTPAEWYEAIDDFHKEREAICLVGGIPPEQAMKTANFERARREGGAMAEMSPDDRAKYLEIVGKKRGRLEMRMLNIFFTNHFTPERSSGIMMSLKQTTGAAP
jgi:hypothetical protein